MHRLLQGDVGAGKTIVALLAAIVAMENGLQVAFMAPTEILAKQHYATHGAAAGRDAVPRRPADRQHARHCSKHTILAHLERGTTHLVVGTHALVQEQVTFHKLGLVVIDEQHRFGVAQRAALRAKGLRPDVLLMTATPIPRTLALTDYSELDVSKITGLPPGPQAGAHLGQAGIAARRDLPADSRASSTTGRQAYVIYPLVEESEKIDLKSATEMADHLQAEVFPGRTASALLHGRMKQDAKDQVMHGVHAGRRARAGVDDGRRSRRGRAERVGDGGRARRALRPVAAAPAARPHRPRRSGSRTASCCISRRGPTTRASG